MKSSLVFLRRKGEYEELGNYTIFMAIADYIGYDATGRDIPQNDLPEMVPFGLNRPYDIVFHLSIITVALTYTLGFLRHKRYSGSSSYY